MSEVVWPMGKDRDLSSRPLVFDPKGFLVAILEDDDAAGEAKAALEEAGFANDVLRIYTTQQILDDREQFLKDRSVARRVVGGLTDDRATIKLYFDYAQAGRAALWVHVPEQSDATRAIRYLADQKVLHIRHYGHDGQEDIHLR